MQSKSFYGWKLLCVFWLIIVLNFTFPTFGTSVVNTYMAKAMHWNRTELGWAFSVFSLMAGLPGPLVGKSINKWGIRVTLILGTLLSSFGALLMALVVRSVFGVIIVFGLIVGAGVATAGTIAPQVGMARWFHKKRARAISLVLTASAVGGCIAVPTLNWIIARSGGDWRAAWWCMSAMSFVAALVAAIFVKESPAQMGQTPDNDPLADSSAPADARVSRTRSGVYKTREDWTLGEALTSRTLWLLVPTYLGFFMGFFIYIAHGVSHLEGLGYAPGAAAKSIFVIMSSSLIGTFAVGLLGDHIEPRLISAVAVCLYGSGTLLAIHAVTPAVMYSYAILMGTGFGAAFTCMQTILSNYYGVKVYPALLGVVFPMGTILGAVGPVTAGYFYDRYGTYSQVFSIVGALCFVSAVLYLLARPPVRISPRATAAPVRAA
jgi:MFS family permease